MFMFFFVVEITGGSTNQVIESKSKLDVTRRGNRGRKSSSLIKLISYESRIKPLVSLKEIIFVKTGRGCTCRNTTEKS